MIGSLRGVVLDRLPTAGGHGEVVVETVGVGYRVSVGPTTLAMAEVGEPLFLHVHTHVREDALVLYGFATREERGCFEALIAAHGVGPALALAVLAALSPVSLRRAVASADVDALTGVPGVGRKTAARLLIELKPRLDLPDDDDVVVVGEGEEGARPQVRAALAGLGYGPDEVRHAVRDLDPDASVEDQVRLALRRLASASRPRVAAPS